MVSRMGPGHDRIDTEFPAGKRSEHVKIMQRSEDGHAQVFLPPSSYFAFQSPPHGCRFLVSLVGEKPPLPPAPSNVRLSVFSFVSSAVPSDGKGDREKPYRLSDDRRSIRSFAFRATTIAYEFAHRCRDPENHAVPLFSRRPISRSFVRKASCDGKREPSTSLGIFCGLDVRIGLAATKNELDGFASTEEPAFSEFRALFHRRTRCKGDVARSERTDRDAIPAVRPTRERDRATSIPIDARVASDPPDPKRSSRLHLVRVSGRPSSRLGFSRP